MRGLNLIVFSATFLACLGLSTALTAEPAQHASDKLCLGLTRIDNIDIMNNQNIVFETINGEYYLNQLPRSCPNLSRDKAIMYKTSLNQLCNLDIITLLDNIGGGFEWAGACGLGKFKRISKEDYQTLSHKSAEK